LGKRSMNRLLARLHVKICQATKVGEYRGIQFSDWNQNPNDDARFVTMTNEALTLIERLDPRRFLRVRRQLQFIQNTELCSGGHYLSCGICQVDFGRYDRPTDSDWWLYQYAGTIVHEATHGLIVAKGIRTNRKNWIRIERICRAEQNGFLARIQSRYGSKLMRPFTPKKWDQMGSRFARMRTIWRRMKEEEAKAQQPPSGDGLEPAPEE
jgi:hypothetical protein